MQGQYGTPPYRQNPTMPRMNQSMPVNMNYMNRMPSQQGSMYPNPYNQQNVAMMNRMNYSNRMASYQVQFTAFVNKKQFRVNLGIL